MKICIKNSFSHTNKYIILATPLILFSLLSSLYLAFTAGSGKLLSMLIAIILFFLMFSAFLAGWFNMITISLKDSDRENVNSLMTEFPAGVGEYMLPMMGFVAITFAISLILITISTLAGIKLIGSVGIPAEVLAKAMNSAAELKTLLLSLSETQLIRLNLWNILFFGTMALTYFLIMFYPAAIFFKKKNPFTALITELKVLFSIKFIKNILVFVIIFGLYFILSVAVTLFSSNIVLYFILTLANFYFMVFGTVFVFNYYYSNYVKIGSFIDTVV